MLSTLYNRLEKYENRLIQSSQCDIFLDKNGMLRRYIPETMINDYPLYRPQDCPALWRILADNSPVKIIIGPFQSGKSSGIMQQIMIDAINIPPCDDKIRRSKVAFVRNTQGDLETTTLETWLFWARILGLPQKRKKPITTYNYSFSDKNGKIELSIIFLALDREDDCAKLDSLELTHVYFNELRHIPKPIFDRIYDRCGRFPAKSNFMNLFNRTYPNGTDKEYTEWFPYQKKIYADTNPPSNRHWIPELEQKHLKYIKIYHQPPALIKNPEGQYIKSANADNLRNMDPNYYLDMIERGEEYVRVYAQGYYGNVLEGKRVYAAYNDDFHSQGSIKVEKEIKEIRLGLDFGYICPACIITQFVHGQIRIIKEFFGDSQSIKSLFQSEVIPWLNKNLYSNQFISCIGDPSNTWHGIEQLFELDIECDKARSNNPEERINAVSNLLLQNIQDPLKGAQPQLIISREGCPFLREGFISKYHYKELRTKEVKYSDYPEKNHPYSDIHDCLQYLALEFIELNKIDELALKSRQEIINEYHEEDRSDVTGY